MITGFIDPAAVTFTNLAQASGPGLFVPLDRADCKILVGQGENPEVTFLEGPNQGEAFQRSLAENWEGIFITGVEVEADLGSVYSMNTGGKISGALVHHKGGVGILGKAKSGHSFTHDVIVIIGGEPAKPSGVEFGFKKWRLVWVSGDRRVPIYEHEVLLGT